MRKVSVFATVLAVVITAAGCGTSSGSSSGDGGGGTAKRSVVLEVTGTGTVDVAYETKARDTPSSAEITTPQSEPGVTLPWTKTIELPGHGGNVLLTVKGDEETTSAMACRVAADGKEVERSEIPAGIFPMLSCLAVVV
jgi:hypothetical protein